MNWPLLKRPLYTFAAVLVLSVMVLAYVYWQYQVTYKHYLSASSERYDAYSRYQRAESDLALFMQYKDRFLDYQRRNIIGTENRLSWAEVLHQQNQDLSLANFNVSISPRQPVQRASSSETLHWYQSTQTIKAGLLHEGDLYQILNSLKQNADGLFRVSTCDLLKSPQIQLVPQAQNISMDCTLQWYSLTIQKPQDSL